MKNKLIAITMALPPTILCAGLMTDNYHLALVGFAGLIAMMIWGLYETQKHVSR